jgi:SAM-dependent methyltransferase
MSQKTAGLYRLTQWPALYALLQGALGGGRTRASLIRDHLRPSDGMRVLDIGCGSASLLPDLGAVHYTGIDSNPEHIAHARALHGARGRFLQGHAETLGAEIAPPFDLVMCIGVLHHLDDAVVERLATVVAPWLAPGGRFVTVDPAFVAGQNPIARFLAARDSGQNVRAPEAYRALLAGAFPKVAMRVRHDLLRVPYTHCILEASQEIALSAATAL